jgi:hypothetical protein
MVLLVGVVRGFDYQYGAVLGEIDYFTHTSSRIRDWYRNNRPVKEEGHGNRDGVPGQHR